jgi:Integrase core domain
VAFADEPGVTRIVWLFSLVLGYSRLLWARFVLHQDLQTVLRCHLAAFAALGGVPRQILYDRMKTAVLNENAAGHIVYNRALVDFARHHGYHPKACRPYRAKTKGKVERPYRYLREDFFLARSFQNLDDLNAQLRHWLDTVANPRVHATTGRIVDEAFAEEQPHLQPLPLVPFRSVLRLERRLAAGLGNGAPTPFRRPSPRGYGQRRRQSLQRARHHPQTRLEVQALADEIQIFEAGQLIARHPVLEGRNQRRVAPGHRKALPSTGRRRGGADQPIAIGRAGEVVARRSLDFYEAIALRLAGAEQPA